MGIQFSIADQPVHPHIKLTSEAYPRALATRIIKEDGDEYFGAFLNRTSVRILIDFLNRTFRLRSCAIEIDGTFPVPCTQYYAKRCVAPCVASLCDRQSYLAMVELVRLFLRNERELLRAELTNRIERAAEALDFEAAAFFRDILQNVENFWSKPRWHVWLGDAVDTYELYGDSDAIYVIIITQRGRRALGEMVYAFSHADDPTLAIRDVIEQFYRFHLPREIRVSHDFEDRASFAKKLSTRFGKKIDIVVAGKAARRVTTERALEMAKARLALNLAKTKPSLRGLQDELVATFALPQRPIRIEAFDAAHISATGFAAAVSVWEGGEDRPDEYEHWVSDQASELDTLRAFITRRVARIVPDLLVIDGGRSHLKAALSAIEPLADRRPSVISIVKPKGKHYSVSHLLTEDARRIDFDQYSEAHRLMQRLRDEAHALANATHRLGRDMMHFYELASILPSISERERQQLMREFGSIRKIVTLGVQDLESRFGKRKALAAAADLAAFRGGEERTAQPLIVPIRFVETDGAAEDLIPIETR